MDINRGKIEDMVEEHFIASDEHDYDPFYDDPFQDAEDDRW